MSTETSELWREIASHRSAPPGLTAADSRRRAVFAAALQQAQEFADAGARSGYATKALPMFYAFGQGVRALAAAFIDDDGWEIRHHGIGFDGGTGSILESLVKPWASNSTPGTLQALAKLEGRTVPTQPMSLGDLWRACLRLPLDGEHHSGMPALRLRAPVARKQSDLDAARGILTFAITGVSAESMTGAELAGLLDSYPVLAGASTPMHLLQESEYAKLLVPVGEFVTFSRSGGGFDIPLPGSEWASDAPVLAMETGGDYDQTAKHLGLPRGFALPTLGGVPTPSWLNIEWCRLYALSNLVRYYPAQWVAALDLDSSRLAVPLRRLCDDLEEWVPHILLTGMNHGLEHLGDEA